MDEIQNRVFELVKYDLEKVKGHDGEYISDARVQKSASYLYKTAELRGLKRALEKAYESDYSTLLNNGEMDFIEGRKRLRELADTSNSKIPEWVTITVNVDETKLKDVDKFKQLVHKYTQRSFVKEYIYAFEQRGRDEENRGKGMHAHILIRQATNDAGQFKRDTKSSFKKATDHGVHFRYITTQVEQAIPYIKGIKKDDAKGIMIEQDKLWRSENNLDDWYENFQAENPVN